MNSLRDMIKEKDKTIESLKRELQTAKMIISSLKVSGSEDNKAPDDTVRRNVSIGSEKSKVLKLDFSKAKLMEDIGPEMFSDRSIGNKNLLNTFSLNKLDKKLISTNISNNATTLFRQSNKISNKLNDSNSNRSI